MRVNIYSEELTGRVELVRKCDQNGKFHNGLRFYLELPVSVGSAIIQGPFMHHVDDDDTAAVTFWGLRETKVALEKALALVSRGVAMTIEENRQNAQ